MFGALPLTIITAIASPMARPTPSTTAAAMPLRAAGTDTRNHVSTAVAPSASDASSYSGGTASSAVTETLMIVLAIMILPSIIKVSVTALEAVPHEYEDASLALGATEVETYFRVSVPAAKSGIAAAVVLGVGRAIGEAMAVMMVSGNAPNMPGSIFESVRFLTTAVASEMSYSSGLQRQALFSIALVLYLFILLINAALNFFLKRDKEGN